MKAMILAAGRGTRVQPLTNTLAKPMLPILGIPVMELIIFRLKENGFKDIVINTAYLSETIEDYFKNGEEIGVNISYSFEGSIQNGIREGKAVGSAAGMKKIQIENSFFDDTFLVICGDAIIDADLEQAIKLHKMRGGIASILLKEVPKSSVWKYGVVELSTSNKVVSFQEKPDIDDARSNLVNTGIYIFEPKVLSYIPDIGNYDIGSDLFPKLVQNNVAIYGLNLPFQWIDIGTLNDYYNANLMALNNKINDISFVKNKLHLDFVKHNTSPHDANLNQCKVIKAG